ncbi:DUF6612 family protein [Bacillus thermotolerans]|uniref:Lipoprotein n=1 Tax=Bacillus thermotolerans TaxID=1221996 RepID=A0A0F5I8X0_BACTR|nr:DUF6612 family protein [Bacillus thermotolerans]KKB41745.1 hypothetical protein QY95_00552 [Bacillus thermotolerans]KKB44363.1 hypothetical protein QY96_02963 [Bacillus thermotolerans]
MNKWTKWMAAGVLTMGLAACGQTAEPTPDTPEEQQSEMTLAEVYDRAIQVSNETKSMSTNMDMKQSIQLPSQGATMETAMKMEMDVTTEPLAIYQTGTMTMTGEGAESSEPVNVESYMTEKGFFLHDSASGQWIKMPSEMYDQIMNMSKQQSDPNAQLQQLNEFKDDFTFEQTADEYVLKLNAEGEKFKKLVEEQMSQVMPGVEGEEAEAMMQEMLKAMDIEKVDYAIYIDKESFQTMKMDVVMDMSMNAEGNELQTSQTMNMVYSNFNKVEPIQVPEEVINSAQEMPMPEAAQ